MVRSFTIKPSRVSHFEYIGDWLDDWLVTLQNTGWKIISIKPSNISLYDYNQHKSVYGPMYIIVAEGGDYDAFKKEMEAD